MERVTSREWAFIPALIALTFVAGCSIGTPESGAPATTGAHASGSDSSTGSPAPSSGAPTAGATSAQCAIDISDWSTERKIAQPLVVFQPADGPVPEPWRSSLGGIFLPTLDVAAAVGRSMGDSTVRPFIAVDDEGGRVNWDDDHPTTLVAPLDQADQTLEDVRRAAEERGRWLANQGIDVTFAPVVDLYPGERSGVIGDTAFSGNPQTVIDYASAFAEGMSAAGIRSTLKHFPGHGRADGDSHLELATTAKLSWLEKADLVFLRQQERAKVTADVRYRIPKRDGHRCRSCGNTAEVEPLHVDHIIPIAKGGKSDLDNLQTLCQSCNLGKGARH